MEPALPPDGEAVALPRRLCSLITGLCPWFGLCPLECGASNSRSSRHACQPSRRDRDYAATTDTPPAAAKISRIRYGGRSDPGPSSAKMLPPTRTPKLTPSAFIIRSNVASMMMPVRMRVVASFIWQYFGTLLFFASLPVEPEERRSEEPTSQGVCNCPP